MLINSSNHVGGSLYLFELKTQRSLLSMSFIVVFPYSLLKFLFVCVGVC